MNWTLFHIVALLVLVPTMYAWSSLAPWAVTRKKDVALINALADLKPGATFMELGCGNARVCSYIARHNPQATVIGIELAFFWYVFSWLRVRMYGPSNLTIRYGNALKYDWHQVDVLYTYALIKTINTLVQPKAEREMKPGAKLISYTFSITNWSGTSQTHPGEKTNIHVYHR